MNGQKYTAEQAECCRALRRDTLMTYRQIAKEVGVSATFVQISCYDIITRDKAEQDKKTVDLKMELAARAMVSRYREQKMREALSAAQPDGSHCVEKACPYLALLDGRCRQHYIDFHSSGSLQSSTLTL